MEWDTFSGLLLSLLSLNPFSISTLQSGNLPNILANAYVYNGTTIFNYSFLTKEQWIQFSETHIFYIWTLQRRNKQFYELLFNAWYLLARLRILPYILTTLLNGRCDFRQRNKRASTRENIWQELMIYSTSSWVRKKKRKTRDHCLR